MLINALIEFAAAETEDARALTEELLEALKRCQQRKQEERRREDVEKREQLPVLWLALIVNALGFIRSGLVVEQGGDALTTSEAFRLGDD